MRLQFFPIVILSLISQCAIACSPLPDKYWENTPRRVKENFDNALFVVVANIIDVKTVYESKPELPDFKMKLEQVKFQIERTFKGDMSPGENFLITSGNLE